MSSQASLSSHAMPVRKTAPVTAHPWFPAIVALWFAALLGLSSLVLAPALLERIVAASGIANFVAAAAPPLGQTARLLLALGLAGFGGVVGLALGRILAARRPGSAPHRTDADHNADEPSPVEPALGLRDRLARLTGQGDGPRDFDDLPKLRARDRHPDAPGRKPLSAEDVILPDAIDADAFAANSSDYPEAPLDPADDLRADDPEISPTAQADEAVAFDEPLELEAVVADEPAAPAEMAAPAPAPAPVSAAVAAITAASLESLGIVQLTERLAISMHERRERDARRAEAERAGSGQNEEAPIVLPSMVSLHSVRVHPEAPAEPAPATSDTGKLGDRALETGYSSLLGLTRKPAAKQPVRPAAHSPEPQIRPGPFSAPAATTPFAVSEGAYQGTAAPNKGPEASDPGENYRALKAALSSLQQISGTR